MLTVVGACTAFASAPAWLVQDAASAASLTVGEKGATILRSERIITVSDDGTWQQVYRYAVRVERDGGAGFAAMAFPYIAGTDEIQRSDAWLVRQGKTVQSYPRKQWVDRAEVDDVTLYSDFRSYFVACPIAVRADVFGGEIQVRQSGYLGQQEMCFTNPLPALLQRLEVHAPQGWNVNLTWLKGKAGEGSFSPERHRWVWEIRDQPEDRLEVWAPEEPGLRAALTVAPSGNAVVPVGVASRSWQEVAKNLAVIQEPQCDSNSALTETARRLTSGLADPWKKIQALTAFVQNRRYIAVNRNNGLGFGYRPRKASDVLAADCGDCKDKSNLLRALLREAGFRAYLVAAYIGDSDAVHPEWPSPTQFNHAIVAVEVPSGSHSPATLDDPIFGHLLFFDSTARWIPAGHLPWTLQGGWGLVCDARSTGLIRFPADAADEEFKVVSKVNINIDALGGCQGDATEVVQGQLLPWIRERETSSSSQQQMGEWTRRLSGSVNSPTIERLVSDASADGWGYTTTLRFSAAKFGQPFRSGMRLFNINILWPDVAPLLSEKPRQHDLLARPIHLEHEVSVNLPAGSQPEVPGLKIVQSSYGQFKVSYENTGDRIICRRTLILNPMRVPADQYPEYRRFFSDVAKAERTVLLVRSHNEIRETPAVPESNSELTTKP